MWISQYLEFNRIDKALYGFVLLMCLSACNKNDNRPEFLPGTDGHVNNWILDSMLVYYYWDSSLPKEPDVNRTPITFFSSIKNPEDRFSILVDSKDRTTYDPTLASAFGLDLVAVETDGQAQVLVLLVVPGSNAAISGIKRGDRVEAVNYEPATTANLNKLIDKSIRSGSLNLQMSGQLSAVKLSANYPFERPVYSAKVIDAGMRKVAYLFLNSFRSNQVHELKTAFTNFKTGQATELIIDMRYNAGGEVSAAALLATMIAPVGNTDVFAEYRGNVNTGIKKRSFNKELSFIGETVNGLTGYRLPLQRVYLLTGRHTASSAELLANSLAPYIDVVSIGETTLGKDMASLQIKDMRSPQLVTDWVIYPLVYKLYNARGQGDYKAGIVPDISVNELAFLPLQPIGAVDDPLIAMALAQLSGNYKISRQKTDTRVLMDTRDAIDAQSSIVIIPAINFQ